MSGQGTGSSSSADDAGFAPIDASSFRFAPRAMGPTPASGRRQRVVFAFVLVVHAVLLVLLLLPPAQRSDATREALVVDFVTVQDVPPPAPPPSPAPSAQAVEPPPRPVRRPTPAPVPREPSSTSLQAVEVAPAASPATPAAPPPPERSTLFDDSGNIVVPEAAYEELRRNVSEDRVFDYQIAGLAKAKSAFERRPALEYEPGMFDGSMRPSKSLLVDLLERAVEASTASISIPIPGDPYRRIECKVVVLAAGGGCGMTGFTGYVEEDDPNTLNAEEEAQCAAWWEKITTTNQQQAWIETRKLYDAACRKPRETKPGLPEKRD